MGEWITPPSLPPDTYCRRLLIPNTPQWIGAVSGALRQLTFASAWREVEGITAEEAAERALEMYELYLNSGNGGQCDDMACCDEKIVEKRINPATGRPEVRYNGGEWQPDPTDPKYAVLAVPPIVGEGMTNTRCDAASNALQHFTDIVSETSSNIATASSLFTFVVAIVTVLLEVFIMVVTGGTASPFALTIAGMIWGAAQAVFVAGQAAFDEYWDSDALDEVFCALYNNIGTNGQFTEDQYNAFLSEVRFELASSPARDLVLTAITAGGAVGLSNMASYGGSADSDCSDCAPPADVWFVNSLGNVIEVYPDEEGVYTVDTGSGTLYPGTYYGTVWFTNPDSPVYNSTCRRMEDITILTGTPLIENYVNCDGGSTPQFCNNAMQYVDSGQWSMTFTSPSTCP